MTNTLHLHFLLITHSFAFIAQVLPIKSFIQLLGDFFIFTSKLLQFIISSFFQIKQLTILARRVIFLMEKTIFSHRE